MSVLLDKKGREKGMKDRERKIQREREKGRRETGRKEDSETGDVVRGQQGGPPYSVVEPEPPFLAGAGAVKKG